MSVRYTSKHVNKNSVGFSSTTKIVQLKLNGVNTGIKSKKNVNISSVQDIKSNMKLTNSRHYAIIKPRDTNYVKYLNE